MPRTSFHARKCQEQERKCKALAEESKARKMGKGAARNMLTEETNGGNGNGNIVCFGLCICICGFGAGIMLQRKGRLPEASKKKILSGEEKRMPKEKVKKGRRAEESYHKTEMNKEMVIQKLRESGCRITKQRQILLDIILQEECSSCKEIYYKAVSLDGEIGISTVYRMVNVLEEIGAISRRNIYKISCGMDCAKENACMIELDDNTVCQLSAQNWHRVILEGLRACGYIDGQKVVSVMAESCTDGCLF